MNWIITPTESINIGSEIHMDWISRDNDPLRYGLSKSEQSELGIILESDDQSPLSFWNEILRNGIIRVREEGCAILFQSEKHSTKTFHRIQDWLIANPSDQTFYRWENQDWNCCKCGKLERLSTATSISEID